MIDVPYGLSFFHIAFDNVWTDLKDRLVFVNCGGSSYYQDKIDALLDDPYTVITGYGNVLRDLESSLSDCLDTAETGEIILI